MSEPIKPALTAEEWADPEHRVVRDGFWIYEPPILDCPVIGSEGSGVSIGTVRHALAALALYGQPFGFTREDVQMLREMEVSAPFGPATEAYTALASLADRIEALLPPEKPT